MTCELCHKNPEQALWHNDKLFIIEANEPLFPGFLRVIWKDHVAEVSDLSEQDRLHLFQVLNIIECVMRETMTPDKINWAQFGNMVPHLHWHIIPRYKDDSHFPESVWGTQQRLVNEDKLQQRKILATRLIQALPIRLTKEFEHQK